MMSDELIFLSAADVARVLPTPSDRTPRCACDDVSTQGAGCRGRTGFAQRTFAYNLGIAMEDVVVAYGSGRSSVKPRYWGGFFGFWVYGGILGFSWGY